MASNFHLSDSDRRRLSKIAAQIDAEAATWRDGWCVWSGGVPSWPDKSESGQAIHARVVKLENASRYLRELIREHELGPSPRMEAACAAE